MTTEQPRPSPDDITAKPGYGVKEDFNSFVHHFTEKSTLR